MYQSFIFSFIMLSFSLANLDVIKNQAEIDYIKIGAYNIRQNDQGEFLIDIYANNKESIAGVQFEIIGNDFTIISVEGGRSKNSGFIFHTGLKKGIILAFSMEGKKIPATHSVNKRINTLFTIKLNKNIEGPSEFNVKTLIAGEKGIKLESRFIPIVVN